MSSPSPLPPVMVTFPDLKHEYIKTSKNVFRRTDVVTVDVDVGVEALPQAAAAARLGLRVLVRRVLDHALTTIVTLSEQAAAGLSPPFCLLGELDAAGLTSAFAEEPSAPIFSAAASAAATVKGSSAHANTTEPSSGGGGGASGPSRHRFVTTCTLNLNDARSKLVYELDKHFAHRNRCELLVQIFLINASAGAQSVLLASVVSQPFAIRGQEHSRRFQKQGRATARAPAGMDNGTSGNAIHEASPPAQQRKRVALNPGLASGEDEDEFDTLPPLAGDAHFGLTPSEHDELLDLPELRTLNSMPPSRKRLLEFDPELADLLQMQQGTESLNEFLISVHQTHEPLVAEMQHLSTEPVTLSSLTPQLGTATLSLLHPVQSFDIMSLADLNALLPFPNVDAATDMSCDGDKLLSELTSPLHSSNWSSPGSSHTTLVSPPLLPSGGSDTNLLLAPVSPVSACTTSSARSSSLGACAPLLVDALPFSPGVFRSTPSEQCDPTSDLAEAARPRLLLADMGSRLIGRDADRAAVVELMRTHPIVVLSGDAGVGKSALAKAVCNDAYAIGLVEKATWNCLTIEQFCTVRFTDRLSFYESVAKQLGLQPSQIAPSEIEAKVRLHLRDHPTVLVIDNFSLGEAFEAKSLKAVTGQTSALSNGPAHLARLELWSSLQFLPASTRVIVTSRERGVFGSLLRAVPHAVYTVGALTPDSAFRVFANTALSAAELTLTPQDEPLVRRICERVCYLPLAIEILAGQLITNSLSQLLDDLQTSPLATLDVAGPASGTNAYGFYASLGVTYDALDSEAATLFSIIGMIEGRFTLDLLRECVGEQKTFTEMLDVQLAVERQQQQSQQQKHEQQQQQYQQDMQARFYNISPEEQGLTAPHGGARLLSSRYAACRLALTSAINEGCKSLVPCSALFAHSVRSLLERLIRFGLVKRDSSSSAFYFMTAILRPFARSKLPTAVHVSVLTRLLFLYRYKHAAPPVPFKSLGSRREFGWNLGEPDNHYMRVVLASVKEATLEMNNESPSCSTSAGSSPAVGTPHSASEGCVGNGEPCAVDQPRRPIITAMDGTIVPNYGAAFVEIAADQSNILLIKQQVPAAMEIYSSIFQTFVTARSRLCSQSFVSATQLDAVLSLYEDRAVLVVRSCLRLIFMHASCGEWTEFARLVSCIWELLFHAVSSGFVSKNELDHLDTLKTWYEGQLADVSTPQASPAAVGSLTDAVLHRMAQDDPMIRTAIGSLQMCLGFPLSVKF
ncbi:hypothetical protein CAOG_07158 [Capsaspora owczarzaki ATCC 30864]|uniref:Uncharacterized protein n=1 Tax=Capsaspora owczarzaki (strain ATCC 30864) TaxID=595528 RepID=A0A0D2WVM3_CAPO3|nr:hypothetical protein CAOG_07158 [Capsaspora owczarzaki ATCC 30864]KJE96910.1 hypothetical protein CAOG_007158 [Capsaspora owczarzaki ATCC 30864]|eukprot:XP_004343882.1 hypothetical protein CAOG_07158 [Capsaspora owczarzaki ATCC 30864]